MVIFRNAAYTISRPELHNQPLPHWLIIKVTRIILEERMYPHHKTAGLCKDKTTGLVIKWDGGLCTIRNYDCTGNVLYEWKGTGLANVHSNECAYCGPLWNSGVLVKNCGTAQGLFDTSLPYTNWSQIM